VNSRSMLQIMGAFASYLDVPKAHLKITAHCPRLKTPPRSRQNRVQIQCGKEKPVALSPPCVTAITGLD